MCVLLISSLPSTAVNETNFWHIEPLINTMLNAKYTERFQDANVLLTFRLVGIKSQRLEQQLSGQIKEDINSRGERLYSPEHLGKGLPIYKDDLQWVLKIVCPGHPWYIHLSCRKLEMNRSRNKILCTWSLYNVINQCPLIFKKYLVQVCSGVFSKYSSHKIFLIEVTKSTSNPQPPAAYCRVKLSFFGPWK